MRDQCKKLRQSFLEPCHSWRLSTARTRLARSVILCPFNEEEERVGFRSAASSSSLAPGIEERASPAAFSYSAAAATLSCAALVRADACADAGVSTAAIKSSQ